MNTKALIASLALFCLLANGAAQTQGPPPPPPVLVQSPKQDDVVRITTNLVQVDAVVTKDGKTVPNLKAEDFEIFEDGRKQTITSFAYVSNVPSTTASSSTVADRDKSIPAAPLKRDEPRRTLAIVVDDLGLSAESMSDVRRQLRKFVAQQIQPHDLVAIIRTGADIGALQQFTNDKRLLNRAVESLRWNICSRVGVNVLPPSRSYALGPFTGLDSGCSARSFFSTTRALQVVLDALAELPGRKSMMVLSDSMPIQNQVDPYIAVGSSYISDSVARANALKRVAEKAIRSSVVIYSIDTQGLQTTGITAADRFHGNVRDITEQMNLITATRSRLLFDRRAGGDMIARQTGGFQVRNSNDFKLDRVLEDQSGYYLIGYRPSDETFNKRFHRITAKVKRSGMSLRTRYGFYGYPEEDDVRPPIPKTNLALMSPFGAQDIAIDFTSFFVHDKTAGSAIRSFVYLNAKDLTFVKANDKHEAQIEVHGVIFGNNGVVVEQIKRNGVVSLTDAEYEKALRDGISVRIDMLARRPGAYQVRVATRDVASSRIGAAGQVVVVPDLTKKQLAVSGIVLQGIADSRETGVLEATVANPAVRRYVPNSDLYASCFIYNAVLDPASQRPDLRIESTLFRDGKRVFTYPEIVVDTANQVDLDRILVNLKFRLSAELEPGQYYLRFVITDKLVKDKPPAVQWVDFEMVK